MGSALLLFGESEGIAYVCRVKRILILLFLLSTGNILAQDKLLPTGVHMKIPMAVSSSKNPLNIYEDGVGTINYYSKQNDTVSIQYPIQDLSRAYFASIRINFIFDSAGSQLKNFQFMRYGSVPRGTDNFAIQFALLKFIWLSDSTFYVADSGKECMQTIESASYHYYKSDNPPSTGYISISSDSLFRADTAAFRCNFSFQLFKAPSVSVRKTYIETNFYATFSSKNILTFSIPNYSSPQSLLIYDILGREISQIEIPAGSTSYRMSSAGYPKGTYFARLGSQTASFMIMDQ
ncbi:MAG: hypothetical protein ABI778_00295 [Ignavibacteriota bacterium]